MKILIVVAFSLILIVTVMTMAVISSQIIRAIKAKSIVMLLYVLTGTAALVLDVFLLMTFYNLIGECL